MCTGAEIPAALAATAGTAAAGTAAAGTAAAGTAAAGAGLGAADAGLSALAAAPEMAAGMAGADTAAVPGLLSASPDLATFQAGLAPQFGNGGMAMTDAGGSTIAGAPQPANPFSIGMSNFQNSTLGQGLGRGMDAYGNVNKAQAAMNMFTPQRTTTNVARPPGMGQPAQNVAQGSMGRPMNLGSGLMGQQQGGPDAAKMMILKRIGLLGGM